MEQQAAPAPNPAVQIVTKESEVKSKKSDAAQLQHQPSRRQNRQPVAHSWSKTRIAPKVAPYRVDFASAAAPLGLVAFSGITILSGLINAGIGVSDGTFLGGIGFFYGGFIQLVVGMFDIVQGDALSAALFGSFGTFWMAKAFCYWPVLGIKAAYADPADFSMAAGMLDLLMGFFTVFMIIASQKRTVCFVILLCMVATLYFTYGVGSVRNDPQITKAAGYIGILVGAVGYYHCMYVLLDQQTSYFRLWDYNNTDLVGGAPDTEEPVDVDRLPAYQDSQTFVIRDM